MAYASQDNHSGPGPSSSAGARSRSDIDSPHSPDPAAAIRLRFLVPNPHDSVALSKTLVDIIKDVQATRRSQDGNAYILSPDQVDDLLLLAQQNNRNASASGLASIENQLTELTNKITDVQHAVRGTRPWARPDPLPPNGYAPLVPISDTTPPSTSYGGGSARERQQQQQPVGFVGADGRIYGLMEDQRRMWPYSSERPTWSRDYDQSRSSAAATGELPPWYPIGRRSSRVEEATQPPSGDHQQHVVPRPEPGSSAAASSAYDRDRDPVRPISTGRRSPGPGNHHPGPPPPPMTTTMRFDSEKPPRPTHHHHHHHGPQLSSSSATNHTSASTTVTDSSSKAPSISFLVNPSYDSPSRVVSRESRSPPLSHPPLPHPIQRYEHNGMDVDGHHRPMPDGIDEHRRRRRTALPPKKPSGDSDGARSNGAAPVEVDAAEDMTTRMESEDPSIPTGDSAEDGKTPRPNTAATDEGVKDEEVDQLDWMQPD
ncbi:hypothetical protein FRB90_001215 [Tulasnella sp. 427]|nr:hypothetical protein FRB90_001215 [Tulasnella sp. 427]